LMSAFMPIKAKEVLDVFNIKAREYKDLDRFGLLKNKHKITQNNNIIFKRLDSGEIKAKISSQNQADENVVTINKISTI